jgi:hypothetical protein
LTNNNSELGMEQNEKSSSVDFSRKIVNLTIFNINTECLR